MIDIEKELSYEGKPPAGPCSAWPEQRHYELMASVTGATVIERKSGDGKRIYEVVSSSAEAIARKNKVEASAGTMLRGLARTAGQAMMHGKVSSEIREERYNTCKACPFFVEDSKRCSECGCFMEAKTWIGGDPNALCPKQKWSR